MTTLVATEKLSLLLYIILLTFLVYCVANSIERRRVNKRGSFGFVITWLATPQSLFLVAGQTGHGHGPATRPRPPGHPATATQPPGHGQGTATATRPHPTGQAATASQATASHLPRPRHRPRPPDQDSATQPLATRQSCCFTGYKGGCCELCRLVWRCSFEPTSRPYACSMRSWNFLKCWFYIFVTTRAP